MAKAAAKPKKEVSMEEALWKSADKLRGSVEPAEYKHVVLSLFFLKFASDKFEAQRILEHWLSEPEQTGWKYKTWVGITPLPTKSVIIDL